MERMTLEQELAELDGLAARTDWTPHDVARMQEQLPKMLKDLRGFYEQRRNLASDRIKADAILRQRNGMIEILRHQGLRVRQFERDGEEWLAIFPSGCACYESVGDRPCPLHPSGVGDKEEPHGLA